MVGALFKRNMISGLKVLAILFGVMCLYTTVIIYMFNPEMADMLSGYQDVLPDMMAAVGMTGIAANLLEWIQIYLYGFIMILFPMIFGIIIINKLVTSYIDRGSMANLLASPHARTRIILTQAVSALLLMALLLAAVTAVGVISCEIMFPGELDMARYLELNASEILLQFVVLGIMFTAACFCNDSKYYYMFGAGLPILFFLLQMLSNMGGKLEKLKYCTIYTLFPAEKIVQGSEGFWQYNLAMGVVAVVLFGVSIWWFNRRDLSV